jgi:large subunit ribosomal protein L25
MDEVVHLSDLKMPKGVTVAALTHGEDHDLPVAAIHKPRAAKTEDTDDGADGDEGEEGEDKDKE